MTKAISRSNHQMNEKTTCKASKNPQSSKPSKTTTALTGKLGFPVFTHAVSSTAITGPVKCINSATTPIPFPETRVYDGPIDSYTIYMRDVGMVALLKPEE